MKNVLRFLAVISALLTTCAYAQEGELEPELPELDFAQVTQEYSSIVSNLTHLDTFTAPDLATFVQGTLKLAMAAQQNGEEMPESAVYDALEATRSGRDLDPNIAPWDRMEEILNQLLEEPPEQDQQQQQDQQNQEGGEEQEQQEGENGEQQEGQDGEQQDGQDGEQQEGGEEGQENSESQDGQQGEQQSGEESQSQQQGEQESLGDMEEPQGDVSLDEEDAATSEEERQAQEEAERRAQEQNMQQVGGSQGEGQEATNTQQAVALQQLDKIQENDDPGKLHMLLQQSEGDEQKKSDATPGKDW